MGKSFNLGVLFADQSNNGLTHDYFAGILDNFKRTAEAKGYTISFLNCYKEGETRETYIQQVKARNYDGIVIACIEYEDPEVVELIQSGMPIVTIDEVMENTIAVLSDNTEGIKKLVDYVAEMGHRRIAYITGDDNVVTTVRLNGFREACAKHGIEVPDEYIRRAYYRDMRKATYQTEQLLKLENPPTCILYSDDFAAIGGMNVLRARGMEIPEDISVTGYDGIHILSQYEPRLTTVRQNTVRIGQVAAEKLIQWIEHPDEVNKESVVVETELEKGRTVGRVYY